MVKSAVEEDFFLKDHKDFVLKEQVDYPNGGTSRFYDNGADMVILDDGICNYKSGEKFFHMCSLPISKIAICINLRGYLDFWVILRRKSINIFCNKRR